MPLTPPALLASLLAVGQLFISLSLVSSAFLAPALAALADALALDEPTAGVTLLALGNAAPDAAGALAAVRRGAAQLALGELLGAAAFVSTLVAGVVILAACPVPSDSHLVPRSHVVLPRRSFVRDIATLALGVSAALASIVFLGGFVLHTCLAFLALYTLYAADVLAPPVGLRFFLPRRTGPIHLPTDEQESFSHGGLPRPAVDSSASPPASEFGDDDGADARQHALALGAPHSLLAALEFRDVVAHLDSDAARSRAETSVLGSPQPDAHSFRPSLFRCPSDSAAQRAHPRWSDQAWRDPDPADFLETSSSSSSRRGSLESTLSAPVGHVVPTTDLDLSSSGALEPVPLSRSGSVGSQVPPSRWKTFRLALLPAWPVIWGRGGESWSTRVLALLSTPPLFVFLLTIPIPAAAAEQAQAQAESDPLTSNSIPSTPNARKPRDPAAQARSRAAARSVARAQILPPLHAGFVPGFVVWSLWPTGDEGPSLLSRLISSMSLPRLGIMDWWEGVVQSFSPTQAAFLTALAGWALYGVRFTWERWTRRKPLALRGRHEPRRVESNLSTHSLQALRLGQAERSIEDGARILQPPLAHMDSPPAYELPGHLPGGLPFLPPPPARAPGRWRQLASLTLAFATSVLWITTTVDWLVDLFEELGETMGVSEAVLGATVFAFGNSLGDLVANLALAKVHPHMALAACFATPLLNLTFGVGLAGSLTILFPLPNGSGPRGRITVHANPPLMIAGGGCVLSLALLFVHLMRSKWTLRRSIGWALCTNYAIMFTSGLAFELFSRYSA